MSPKIIKPIFPQKKMSQQRANVANAVSEAETWRNREKKCWTCSGVYFPIVIHWLKLRIHTELRLKGLVKFTLILARLLDSQNLSDISLLKLWFGMSGNSISGGEKLDPESSDMRITFLWTCLDSLFSPNKIPWWFLHITSLCINFSYSLGFVLLCYSCVLL